MIPQQITNYSSAALALLTSQFTATAAPNLRALLSALTSEEQTLEGVLFACLLQRQLATATQYSLPTTNTALDQLGNLVGEPRNGLSDAQYIAAISLRAAVNRSIGASVNWSSFAAILLATTGGGSNPVYLEGQAALDFGMMNMSLSPIVVAATLAAATPNGVRSGFWYSTWSPSLNFEWGSVYSGGAGQGGLGSVYNSGVGGFLIADQPMVPGAGGASSVLPFPSTIANLDYRYRADLGITQASGTVSAWADQSGNANTLSQGTGALQPNYLATGGPNGFPALQSTGTQYIRASAAPLAGPTRNWTAFIVLNSSDNTITGRPFVNGNSWGVQNTTGTRELVLTGVADDLDSTFSANTWELWTIQDNGTNQSMRVNGSAVTLSPNNGTPGAAASTIDAFSSNGSFIFKGKIAEVIAFGRTLTGTEIAQVEAYIRSWSHIW